MRSARFPCYILNKICIHTSSVKRKRVILWFGLGGGCRLYDDSYMSHKCNFYKSAQNLRGTCTMRIFSLLVLLKQL